MSDLTPPQPQDPNPAAEAVSPPPPVAAHPAAAPPPYAPGSPPAGYATPGYPPASPGIAPPPGQGYGAPVAPGAAPGPYAAPPGYASPAGYAPAYGYAGYAPAPRTNGLAVTAMVSSLVGVALSWTAVLALGVVVGVITGHIALRQIARTGERGRGMALAGVIIGWISIGFTLVIVLGVVIWASTTASLATFGS